MARPGPQTSGHPAIFPVRRTAGRAAGSAATARSPPDPGTGPAARHGVRRGCGPAPFLAHHECRGATAIVRWRNKKGTMSWLIISPPILDHKHPIAHAMYWSNSWSGGVLIALAAAGLGFAALRRTAR